MKKITSFILAITLFIGIGTASAISNTITKEVSYNNIKVTIDGKSVNMNNEPFIIEGTTYLPVRDVAEALGLNVTWDGTTNTVVLSHISVATIPAIPSYVTPPATTTTNNSQKIYITTYGKKWHYDNSCNGGTYFEATMEEALRRNLTPCDKCVKDVA